MVTLTLLWTSVINYRSSYTLTVFLPVMTARYPTARQYHTCRRHYTLLWYVDIRRCRPFVNVSPYSCRASGRPNCIITRRPDCTRAHTDLTGVQDKCSFCTPRPDETHHALLCHHYNADRSSPAWCSCPDVGSTWFWLLLQLHLETGQCWLHCTFRLRIICKQRCRLCIWHRCSFVSVTFTH